MFVWQQGPTRVMLKKKDITLNLFFEISVMYILGGIVVFFNSLKPYMRSNKMCIFFYFYDRDNTFKKFVFIFNRYRCRLRIAIIDLVQLIILKCFLSKTH